MDENSYTEYLRKQREKEAKWETDSHQVKSNFSIEKTYFKSYTNSENPQIEIKPKKTDFFLIFLGYAVLIIFWIATWYIVSVSPEIVPIHFGSGGKADGFGSKDAHWVLPVIGTVIFFTMSLLPIKRPWIANYPVKITEENAERQYRMMIRFFYVMRIAILLVFFGILVLAYQASKMIEPKLGLWFVPLIFLVFLPLFVFIGLSLTDKKRPKTP